jgi:hypothetical protein
VGSIPTVLGCVTLQAWPGKAINPRSWLMEDRRWHLSGSVPAGVGWRVLGSGLSVQGVGDGGGDLGMGEVVLDGVFVGAGVGDGKLLAESTTSSRQR